MTRLLFITLFIFAAFVPSASAGIYGILTGTVLDTAGHPVSSATIRLLETHLGAVSKANGKFSITKIRHGAYKMQITADGFFSDTTEITIKQNSTLKLPPIALKSVPVISYGTLTGTITDTAGNPIAGAEIRLLRPGQHTISRSDGTFVITGIWPGTYETYVMATGFLLYRTRVVVHRNSTVELTALLIPNKTVSGTPYPPYVREQPVLQARIIKPRMIDPYRIGTVHIWKPPYPPYSHTLGY